MKLLLCGFVISVFGCAQTAHSPLDAPSRAIVLKGVIQKLDEAYVFPETATKMGDAIREHQAKGEYDAITDPTEFARLLTTHLRAVSHDLHLHVDYNAEPVPLSAPPDMNAMRRQMEFTNFGVEKVERLPGNIGYLDLRGFAMADLAKDTGAAAMNVLANADALIIDVRNNGGGDPAMVQFITSYLYGPTPVHLNDLYFRPSNQTTEWWTLKEVPGKRMPDKDVYVLTSTHTFSAAEEFTYNLKCLKRATIIGEHTGGGAHPGGPQRITDHFSVWVPSGRAINPITKKNWEGDGVQPDVPVAADKALKTAHLMALKKANGTVADQKMKQNYERLIANLEKETN